MKAHRRSRLSAIAMIQALPVALIFLGFLAPAVLSATDVPVTVNGFVSLTGTSSIYNGQYVIFETDFGFLWLDTSALQGGHVQAEGKCIPGLPTSDSGVACWGDCNGISDVRSSGSLVEGIQFSHQCIPHRGCTGSAVESDRFFFDLGTWSYLGDQTYHADISNSTQTTDPQGQTWSVQIGSPPDLKHYVWHSSGDPNAPPSANATAVNNSAASRTDKTNYFGDQWTLTDTSTSIATIDEAQWNYIYNGTFVDDQDLHNPPTNLPGESYSYPFPCPAAYISTPSQCYANLGQPPYKFALRAHNTNGWSTTNFVSASISVSPPQIRIMGFSGGTLNILTGGNADARNSQGNTRDSGTSFSWAFHLSGGRGDCSGNFATCAVVAVPSDATSFNLTVTYPDGYPATASGQIQQTDLVPAFSLAPDPVLVNASLTLTNQMQKSGTIANPSEVDYEIDSGACGSPAGNWALLSNSDSQAGFLQVNGTAVHAAPGTQGSYCMYLQYTFTDHLQQQEKLWTSDSFSVTDFTANPAPFIALDSGGNQPACGLGTCALKTSTTYYLFDEEFVPNGAQYPGSSWEYDTSSGSTQIGNSAGEGPVTWNTSSSTCSSGCSVKLTVGTAAASLAVALGNGGSGGGNDLHVTISGPAAVNVGQPASYTANVSGKAPPFTYQWNFGDGGPVGGTQTMAHTWAATGAYTVSVTATSGQDYGSGSLRVTAAGLTPPSGGLTLNPSQLSPPSTYTVGVGQPVTFTSTETNASLYGWIFGDGTLAGSPTARVVQKTYSAQGTYPATLQVYGDGVHTVGITAVNFTVIVGAPLPSPTFTVSGATQNQDGSYGAHVGDAVTFTASEPNAASWGWTFGDGTIGSGKVAGKSYAAAGNFTVTLQVTGDGVNNTGTTSSSATMKITPSTFQAVIVPGVAHLNDGTTTWTTDFSVTNPGTAPTTINLAFLPLLPDQYAPTTLNLSQISYGNPILLEPGGSYSVSDVVSSLGFLNNKGTLVIKYTGNVAPLVTTRVSFAPAVNPNKISYGSALPAYQVDSSGRISAQGFNSVALEGEQSAGIMPAGIRQVQQVEDFGITVNLAGTGSGTVTSSPAGINCPTTCTATFPPSSYVELSGHAASGSSFFDFTSGCDSDYFSVCGITMTSAKTVTARFDATGPPPPPPPGNATLTVSKGGSGTGTVTSVPAGISCGATCSFAYTQNTQVTLSAAPASGSTFAGWGGACTGTGSCVVTLASDTSVSAAFNAGTPPNADEVLIGLRSDAQYRFAVTLFNAAGSSGTFRLSALDNNSSPVLILDGVGGHVAYRDFTILPYQQVYLRDADLGLTDPAERYVVKSKRTSSSGTLLAFGAALDRRTNDFLQVTDDSQTSQPDQTGTISYWVAGVSRYDAPYGAHWRTDLRIFNLGNHSRNLYFDYDFTQDGRTEHVAHVNQVPIAAGQLLTYDDVIDTLMAQDKSVDLSGSSAGILRIYYAQDSDSSSNPLIIGSRNYDDQPAGTAGSQLALYTPAQAASPAQQLVLSGVEESAQYSSKIGVFTIDSSPVTGVILAVAADGTQVGSMPFAVGGGTVPHYGQIDLTGLNGFANPNQPVSIRIVNISGGRLAAYAFIVNKVTLDTNFIQALPQQPQ